MPEQFLHVKEITARLKQMRGKAVLRREAKDLLSQFVFSPSVRNHFWIRKLKKSSNPVNISRFRPKGIVRQAQMIPHTTEQSRSRLMGEVRRHPTILHFILHAATR